MDSNTKTKVEAALLELKETGVSYVLMVEDDIGVTIFSNSPNDKFYHVE